MTTFGLLLKSLSAGLSFSFLNSEGKLLYDVKAVLERLCLGYLQGLQNDVAQSGLVLAHNAATLQGSRCCV